MESHTVARGDMGVCGACRVGRTAKCEREVQKRHCTGAKRSVVSSRVDSRRIDYPRLPCGQLSLKNKRTIRSRVEDLYEESLDA